MKGTPKGQCQGQTHRTAVSPRNKGVREGAATNSGREACSLEYSKPQINTHALLSCSPTPSQPAAGTRGHRTVPRGRTPGSPWEQSTQISLPKVREEGGKGRGVHQEGQQTTARSRPKQRSSSMKNILAQSTPFKIPKELHEDMCPCDRREKRGQESRITFLRTY